MPNTQENARKKVIDSRILLIVSSAVIILLLAVFLINSMVRNPLEGDWYCQDKGIQLDVDEDEVTLEFSIDGVLTEVDLFYTIDKREKILTVKPNPMAYAEAAEDTDGKVSAQQIDEYLKEIPLSFSYSLDNDTLTLSEREYGEEFIFTRVK